MSQVYKEDPNKNNSQFSHQLDDQNQQIANLKSQSTDGGAIGWIKNNKWLVLIGIIILIGIIWWFCFRKKKVVIDTDPTLPSLTNGTPKLNVTKTRLGNNVGAVYN